MKIIKFTVKVIGYACIAYAVFFALWLFLVMGCMSSQAQWQSCGQNTMTDIARVLYAPLF